MLARCAPEFVEHDHRSLAVLGTTRGAEAWVQNFRTLTELAPDTVYRVDHFRSAARGFCSVGTWHGTREGGGYEIPLIAVIEMDARDRMARADIYDLEQADQAQARFAALLATPRAREGEAPAEPHPARPRLGGSLALPGGSAFRQRGDRRGGSLAADRRRQRRELGRAAGELRARAGLRGPPGLRPPGAATAS